MKDARCMLHVTKRVFNLETCILKLVTGGMNGKGFRC